MTLFEANGAKFIAEQDVIVHWLAQGNGPFEPDTTPWLFARMAGRKGLYVDVGASTGWFAVPMALRGHEVVAVECNQRVLARLRANLALNAVSAEVHAVAASDATGAVAFHHNPGLPLTSGGSLEAAVRGNRASETVMSARLDDIIGARVVTVLKIDVEGHEAAVMAGGRAVIERDRPFMALEANTPLHRQALADILADLDYDFHAADGRNLLCSPRY